MVADRERHIADKLSAVAAARNREFARLLAQSQIPEAALDEICAALNDEPVPPADPLVTLEPDAHIGRTPVRFRVAFERWRPWGR